MMLIWDAAEHLSGGRELLDMLKADSALLANRSAKAGIEEMTLLFTYLDAYQVLDKVDFTLP